MTDLPCTNRPAPGVTFKDHQYVHLILYTSTYRQLSHRVKRHAPTLLAFVLLISCGTSRDSEDTNKRMNEGPEPEVTELSCEHTVRWVRDTSEGCGILLIMPNGVVLEPVQPITMETGEAVDGVLRVSMEIVVDGVPKCPSAQNVVRVTCLAPGEDLTGGKGYQCEEPRDIFMVAWMKQLMDRVEPHTVTKYDYRERIAYSFRSDTKEVIVDCYGVELCRQKAGEEECMTVRSQLSNERVILVVNEQKNDQKE